MYERSPRPCGRQFRQFYQMVARRREDMLVSKIERKRLSDQTRCPPGRVAGLIDARYMSVNSSRGDVGCASDSDGTEDR